MVRDIEYELKAGRGRREVTNRLIQYNDVQNNMSNLLEMTYSQIYQYQYFEETQGVTSHTKVACMNAKNLTGLDGLETQRNTIECLKLDSC